MKPPGKRVVEPQSVLKACRKDENLINTMCEEERDLTENQAKNRRDWRDNLLEARPDSKDWNDIAFSSSSYILIILFALKYSINRRAYSAVFRPVKPYFQDA
jgi:hypothetical protein